MAAPRSRIDFFLCATLGAAVFVVALPSFLAVQRVGRSIVLEAALNVGKKERGRSIWRICNGPFVGTIGKALGKRDRVEKKQGLA